MGARQELCRLSGPGATHVDFRNPVALGTVFAILFTCQSQSPWAGLATVPVHAGDLALWVVVPSQGCCSGFIWLGGWLCLVLLRVLVGLGLGLSPHTCDPASCSCGNEQVRELGVTPL